MKKMLLFLFFSLSMLSLMSGNASAAGAAPVADITALLTGIDFTTVLTGILGIVAAGIVYFLGKGGGVQVMHFVRKILGA